MHFTLLFLFLADCADLFPSYDISALCLCCNNHFDFQCKKYWHNEYYRETTMFIYTDTCWIHMCAILRCNFIVWCLLLPNSHLPMDFLGTSGFVFPCVNPLRKFVQPQFLSSLGGAYWSPSESEIRQLIKSWEGEKSFHCLN